MAADAEEEQVLLVSSLRQWDSWKQLQREEVALFSTFAVLFVTMVFFYVGKVLKSFFFCTAAVSSVCGFWSLCFLGVATRRSLTLLLCLRLSVCLSSCLWHQLRRCRQTCELASSTPFRWLFIISIPVSEASVLKFYADYVNPIPHPDCINSSSKDWEPRGFLKFLLGRNAKKCYGLVGRSWAVFVFCCSYRQSQILIRRHGCNNAYVLQDILCFLEAERVSRNPRNPFFGPK